MIKIVIADDYHLIRQGIKAVLEKSDDIQVIGEATDGQEAVVLVEKLEPDIVIMDIMMPRLNGIEAIAKIRTLNVKTQVVVLSRMSEVYLIRNAFKNGAKGYVVKRSHVEELFLAIRSVLKGQIYLSPLITEFLVNDYLNLSENSSIIDLLITREREVLQLIAEGHTNGLIAEMLNVSIKTIEKYRTSLTNKLNIHDTAGLVRAAIKYGLVSVDH